ALDPPEKEKDYPEPSMFGDTPAYGFVIRHVRGIQLSHVDISYLREDRRPALVLADVNEAEISYLWAQQAPGVPALVLKNVDDFGLHQSDRLADVRWKHVL